MTIPGSRRAPGSRQQINLLRGPTRLGQEERILLNAYRAATADDSFDLVPVRVESREDAEILWGTGSQAAIMVARAFDVLPIAQLEKPRGDTPEIWVIVTAPPVAAIPSTVAVFTITIVGTTTVTTSAPLYVGGQLRNVRLRANADATAVAAEINNVILGLEPEIPFTTSVAAGVVTLTGREDGEHLNDLFLWLDDRMVQGITATVARTIDSDGTVDLAPALSASESKDWAIVVLNQYDDATRDLIKPHIVAMWDKDTQRRRRVIYGHGGLLTDARTDALSIDDWRAMTASLERRIGTGIPWDPTTSARSFAWEGAAAVASRIETQKRANFNYNGVQVPVAGRPRESLTGAEYDNAADDGVTLILDNDRRNFRGVIVDPLSTATTDQTGATTTIDRQWQPFEIPRTERLIAAAINVKMQGFDQSVGDSQFVIDVKAASLNVLRTAQTAGWITGVTDAGVVVTLIVEGPTQVADIQLNYGVIVGVDIIDITHNVRRARGA